MIWLALVLGVALVVFLVGRMLRRDPFPVARGKALDRLGATFGVTRMQRESDAKYRERIHQSLR